MDFLACCYTSISSQVSSGDKSSCSECRVRRTTACLHCKPQQLLKWAINEEWYSSSASLTSSLTCGYRVKAGAAGNEHLIGRTLISGCKERLYGDGGSRSGWRDVRLNEHLYLTVIILFVCCQHCNWQRMGQPWLFNAAAEHLEKFKRSFNWTTWSGMVSVTAFPLPFKNRIENMSNRNKPHVSQKSCHTRMGWKR